MNELVLVVDDDDGCRHALCALLEQEGFVAHAVRNGREALEAARRLRPAAIVLDLEMPEMDGWALLEAIAADPGLSAIPCLVTSGCVARDERGSLALPVFPKPVDGEAVVYALRTKQRGRVAPRAAAP